MQTTDIAWTEDEDLLDRFFKKVNKETESGCWEWTAGIGSHGYGAFAISHGDIRLAHRVSYAIEHGETPEASVLCHTCDNPTCVNPDHLYAGDQSDNLRDAVERGECRIGENHQNAKLTKADVLEIRRRYAAGDETQAEIASDFDISRPTVSDIVRGERWSHV